MTGSKRTAGALALSFAAYLAPFAGPHAGWLLGTALWRELTRSGRVAREPLWFAADVAVALIAQLGFFLLLYWFLGRPGWRRGLGVVAPILPAIVLLDYVYVLAIPTHFLIESDRAPEHLAWPLACTARDVRMMHVGRPMFPPREAPIWVVEAKPPHRYGRFDSSDCAVTPTELTHSDPGYLVSAAGGRALYGTMTPSARPSWIVLTVASGAIRPLEVDRGQFPILSTNGRSAAWLQPVAGSPPPPQLEAVVRSLEDGDQRIVDLSRLGRGWLQLIEFDAEAGTLFVARGLAELSVVDLDGRVRDALPRFSDVKPQLRTVRLVSGGWVAWDVSCEEDGPCRVAWSFSGGKGVHRLPKGRSVTSLAPSPDGRWIALSVASNLSIGSTPDAVYVLRAADGGEVFRRYFPKYTASSVAFAGERFVYTDLAGINVIRIE